MVTKVIIDPRLIAAWTSSTNYRIEIESGLVREVGNNRSYSPALTVMTDTTYASGPLVTSVEPAYQSIAATSNAVINFDHALFPRDAINFYLYKTDTQELIKTIPMTDERVTVGIKDVSIDLSNLMLGGISYFLTSDPSPFEDIYNFKSQQITSSTFKYTPQAAPIVNQYPNPYSTETFAGSAAIYYGRQLTANSGTWVLHREETGDTRTFNLTDTIGTSTQRRIVYNPADSSISIRLIKDQPMPEGRYYFTTDDWTYTDIYGIGLPGISNSSTFTFFQRSITGMGDKTYEHTISQPLFSFAQVLDEDLDPNKIYTLTMENTLGEFISASAGTTVGNLYISTGTKDIITQGLRGISFTPQEPGVNEDGTYSYTLTKDDVVLVSKTFNLLGIPYSVNEKINLSIDGHIVIDEPINLTATVDINTTMSGALTFKENGIALSTATLNSSGVATATVVFSTTGTKFLSAEWEGGKLTNRITYLPAETYDKLINVKLAEDYDGTFKVVTLRNGFWADINLAARFLDGVTFGAGDGTVTFKTVETENATVSYSTVTSINILSSGAKSLSIDSNWDGSSEWGDDKYWIKVDNVYDLATGDWITITGKMGEGITEYSSYRVSEIHPGNFISLDARSEDNNLYTLDTLKNRSTNPVLYNLDPISHQAILTKPGLSVISENVIGTATIVNNIATIPTISLATGTYTIVADWSGRTTIPKYSPLRTDFFFLNAADRADYPMQELGSTLSSLLLTGPSYVHQLKNVEYTLTNLYSTSTTGTITLSSFNTSSNSLLDTDLFNVGSLTFQVNPNDFVNGVNKVQAYWEGQEYVPGVYYPYYGTSSNAVVISEYVLGSLTMATNTQTNTVNLPLTFTATANTSSASAGTVSFYNGATLLGTTATNNNSATLTVSKGTIPVGTHNITAKWNDTTPQVNSNILSQKVVSYTNASVSANVSVSTFMLYNQDNSFNTATITANVAVSGSYPTHEPSGNVKIVDDVLSFATGTLTVSTGTSSVVSLTWNPGIVGQTAGTKNLSFTYEGDDWNNVGSISKSLVLTKPTASLTISQTSTMTYFVGYPVILSVTKNSGTVLSEGIKIRNSTNNTTYGSSMFVDNTATVDFNIGTAGSTIVKAVYDEDTYHKLSSSTAITVTTIKEPLTRLMGGRNEDWNYPHHSYFTESEIYYVTDIITFKVKLWKKTERPLTGRFRFAGQSYASFSREANYGTPSKPQSLDIQVASIDLNGTETIGTLTDITFTATAVLSMNGIYSGIWGWFEGSTLFAPTSAWSGGNSTHYILSDQRLSIIKNPVTLSVDYLKNGQWFSTWPYQVGEYFQRMRITRTSTRNKPWSGTMTVSSPNFGSATFIGDTAVIIVNRLLDGNPIGVLSVSSSQDNYHATSSLSIPDPYA